MYTRQLIRLIIKDDEYLITNIKGSKQKSIFFSWGDTFLKAPLGLSHKQNEVTLVIQNSGSVSQFEIFKQTRTLNLNFIGMQRCKLQ